MRIKNHLTKILLLIALFSVSDVEWTNAAFHDYETSVGNTFTAGCWAPPTIPNLNSPDDGLITSDKLTLKWNDSQIICSGKSDLQYQFRVRSSNPDEEDEDYEHESNWIAETESTIPDDLEDGEYVWDVRAKDSTGEKSDWSETRKFTIDTTPPVVKIDHPIESCDDTLDDEVEIKVTVTDSNPHHYWFEIFDEDGDRVAGVGTVNESEKLEEKEIYKWDTTKVDDGEYVLKLEARDAVGNKLPDEAPVSDDPEDPNDSVDWITVTVDNSSDSDDLKANLMTTFSVSTDFNGETLLSPDAQEPEEFDEEDSAPKTPLLPEQEEEPKPKITKEDGEGNKGPEDTDNPTESEDPQEPEPTTLEDPPEEDEPKENEEAALTGKQEDETEDGDEEDGDDDNKDGEEQDEEDEEEPEESKDSIESII